MGVHVHPTLAKACNEKTLREMEMKHGIRATLDGRFIQANGHTPQIRKTMPVICAFVLGDPHVDGPIISSNITRINSEFDHGPYGGNAA